MNDYATATTSCADSATKDKQRDAFVFMPKGLCEKIVGGNLKPMSEQINWRRKIEDRMMQIKNTQTRYGFIAVLLHWSMALIIIGMLVLGLYMVALPSSPWKFKLYGWHKEFGVLILMLVAVRIAWRFANRIPTLPTYMPNWQKLGAESIVYAFYIMMLAMPITGWLMSSASGFPVSFFGLFVLPDLISQNKTLQQLFSTLHQWLGYGLIALVAMHVGAVLQHYLAYKDNLLRRMWP